MELIALTFFVSVGASVLSGISGGGAGFILTPYYIFIGLSPQQAVATGKVGAIGIAGGTITTFKGTGLINRKLLLPLMAITVGSSFLAAWLIPKVDTNLFQVVIGALLIALIPTLFIKKKLLQPGSRGSAWIFAGYGVYILVSFAQAMFGAGLAVLLTLNLMLLFGLGALEANATKRAAQAVQAVLMCVLLFLQGLVVIGHGVAALTGSLIGGHIGSKIALERGEHFVRIILAVTMAISGVALLALAL